MEVLEPGCHDVCGAKSNVRSTDASKLPKSLSWQLLTPVACGWCVGQLLSEGCCGDGVVLSHHVSCQELDSLQPMPLLA